VPQERDFAVDGCLADGLQARSKELMSWVNVCQRTIRRGVSIYVYVNNHYAGFAPATVEQFQKLWKAAS
jgi:uncharacterized protein YecE (DUF72 family)